MSASGGLLARHEAAAKGLPRASLVIGGKEAESGDGGVFAHVNPSTGQVQAEIPLAGRRDVDAAVAAAVAGANVWRRTHPSVRQAVLLRAADLIERDAELLGRTAALENGLPAALVQHSFAPGAAAWFRYYAGWTDKAEGRVTTDTPEDGFIYTLLEPYGVIAVVLTWNAPLFNLAMKLAPALAAGNSIVLKPAELTPFTAARCVQILREAGLPDGVINLVTGGREAGEALVRHRDVAKISFTGGPETARAILRDAADTLTPGIFELGGKGACLVFDDADLEAVIPFCLGAGFILSGQACAAPTRVLVQASVYQDVVAHLAEGAKTLSVGDPLLETTVAGPLISSQAVERTTRFVSRATAGGARLVAGGGRLGGELSHGHFLQPAVIADVAPDSEIAQSEVFGPVISVMPFGSEAEAIAIANGTPYGLANYIQTRDGRRVRRLARELRSGVVAANGAFGLHYTAPFGGVGFSGYGREGGREGLGEFLRTKTVMIA